MGLSSFNVMVIVTPEYLKHLLMPALHTANKMFAVDEYYFLESFTQRKPPPLPRRSSEDIYIGKMQELVVGSGGNLPLSAENRLWGA